MSVRNLKEILNELLYLFTIYRETSNLLKACLEIQLSIEHSTRVPIFFLKLLKVYL